MYILAEKRVMTITHERVPADSLNIFLYIIIITITYTIIIGIIRIH